MILMIKCASIYTYELDDPAVALGDIESQLAEKIELLDNTVGIIMCHTEFIGSGVARHISENLPFDTAGVTTSSQAVNNEAGELVLTVFVITSDDVRFRTGATQSVEEDIYEPTKAAFDAAAAGEADKPVLAIIFPPLLLKYSGDAYINAWKQVIPGVPVFGTIPADDTLNLEGSETIFCGRNDKTSMAFVLCYGNINPRFLVGTLAEGETMPYRGEITKSRGRFVQEINNVNAYKYFESIGFANNGALAENYLFVPFVINQKQRDDYDGIPVIRGHSSFADDGTAVFSGDVDEGSTFKLLACGSDDVLSTTRQIVARINELPDINGVLMFPCIVRRMMTMRNGPLIELETARGLMNPAIPFMMGYSTGEFCPTSVKNGVPTNRFHNYSLIVLII